MRNLGVEKENRGFLEGLGAGTSMGMSSNDVSSTGLSSSKGGSSIICKF